MHRQYLILILALSHFLLGATYAKTKAGGGVHFADGFEASATSASNGLPVLKSTNGIGIQIFIGEQLGPIGFILNGKYTFYNAKAQYNYTDPTNSSNAGTATDLKTSAYVYNVDLALSMDLLSLGNLHLFIAGGPSAGFSTLVYDKSDYVLKKGSYTGLIKNNTDSAGLLGYFGEAGFEVRGTEFGGQLKAQYRDNKIRPFDTLSAKGFNLKEKTIAFNFFRILK